ncbi:hypothetical protein DFR52_102209 [Hoeflea marina]|uniref:Glycosyl transferase family 1 n=1 Tax=Hoeflea marina TaxID=274592 RepID=A0A317PLC3_9HYPH|nr:hypothetical protein [Hoeflea marina]PWW01547.1 hypothetical protein DFR52_102209 [Hoeflea marina]
MSVLKEEIYISLAYWLRRIGHDVSMDRGRLDPSCLNVLIGFPYVDDAVIDRLIGAGPGYVIFDAELIDAGMINFKPETAFWFSEPRNRLFRHAAAFLTYFEQSARFLQRTFGLPVFKLAPSHCPVLATHRPMGEKDCDIDVLFFGRIYDSRAGLLDALAGTCRLRCLDVGDLTTFHMRNELAARAKIVLHLGHRPPFAHIGLMRLMSMAHIGVFSLSEDRTEIEPELRPLSGWWNSDAMALSDCVTGWLARPDDRRGIARGALDRIEASTDLSELKTFWDVHVAV